MPQPVAYRDADTSWRANARERERESVLMALMRGGAIALDAGARDGHYSRLLAEKYERVVALDLEPPAVEYERVRCVAGDITRLDFPDRSFDCVFCAEVLEHIPNVEQACREILRVARHHIIIGVPYRQDLRSGRMMCRKCGQVWNAWKHVHSFDERRLADLFRPARVVETRFAGRVYGRTNAVSAALMRMARYPWGGYGGPEPCSCGAKIQPPDPTLFGRACAAAAYRIDRIQRLFCAERPQTINVLFEV